MKFVARLSRYALLKQRSVQRLLESANWTAVPDSGSGPKRWATEMGSVPLDAADGADEQASPLRARVVLTRFARDDKHGAGELIDGWQYEMFGTNLEPASWPAAELAALYCARASIENRFVQQGRQLNLGTVWSFEPAGQLLATLVSLWIANLRTVLGASLSGELGTPQPQPEVTTAPALSDAAPAVGSVVDLCGRESAGAAPSGVFELPADPQPPPTTSHADPLLSKLPPQVLAQSLGRKPGWSLVHGELRCPRAHRARFHRLHKVKRYWYAHYKVGSLHCAPCPQREQCTSSPNLGFEPSICLPLAQVLADGHDIDQLAHGAARNRTKLPIVNGPRRTTAPMDQPSWLPPIPVASAALRPTMPAELLPTRLRDRWLAATTDSMALVHLRHAAAPPPRAAPDWAAPTAAVRQRRRLSWTERLRRHALDGEVSLRLVAAAQGAAAWLAKALQMDVIA